MENHRYAVTEKNTGVVISPHWRNDAAHQAAGADQIVRKSSYRDRVTVRRSCSCGTQFCDCSATA